MANVELTSEKTGRKVTVSADTAEFYTDNGWVAASKVKAGSENADTDTSEGAAPASKTTKRGANTSR